MVTKIAVYHSTLSQTYLSLLESQFPELQFLTACNPDEALLAIGEAEILLTQPSIPGDMLREAPHLKWIQVLAAGVDQVLPHVPKDVRLSRVTGTFGQRMAEYAIGYIMATTQRVPEVLRQQANHEWKPLSLESVFGATIGVAGFGSIGSEVARLGSRIGMKVSVYSQSRPLMPEINEWFDRHSFARFMSSADFVVLAMPATPSTYHIVDLEALRSMRPDAWLINLARGSLIDESALVSALIAGRPAGAVLDVFETEPLPLASPLWDMSNVIVTPHHSGYSEPPEAVDLFSENLVKYRLGEPLTNEVNLARGY